MTVRSIPASACLSVCASVFLLMFLYKGETTSLPGSAAVIGQPFAFDTVRTPLDDYIWPTDASRIITSSFGEYRPTHFHAGIDISTHNTTGYRVFSARDGFVWRIGVSPTGYGKMISIKHRDGFVTTYAHLQTFNDPINAIVRGEQLRLERYPVDIVLDSPMLSVKKGEVIAYTGNSGTGPAHLHFEVRDENLNPLNPLLFKDLAIHDTHAPFIRSIAIIPLDARSKVAGRPRPLILPVYRKRVDEYFVPRRIQVSGKIGFGIKTRDYVNGTYHPMGVYRLELYLNDTLTFIAQLDRVPEEESKQILMFYDLRLIKHGRGKFQKLYIDEGTFLPIYGGAPADAGRIDVSTLGDAEHTVRIVCRDIQGNVSEVYAKFLADRQKREPLAVSLSGTDGVMDQGSRDIFAIPSNSAGWFSFDGGALEVVYDSGAVFKPLSIGLLKERQNGTTIYRFEPRDMLLNKGIRVFLQSRQTLSPSTAIYFREFHRWEFQETSYDSATRYYSTHLPYTLGDITLLEDTDPPHIGALRITTRGKQPMIRFWLSDNRSGIDAHEIKMYIDDEFVIPELRADPWRVDYRPEYTMAKGKHTVRITVRDNMKNSSSVTRSFIIR